MSEEEGKFMDNPEDTRNFGTEEKIDTPDEFADKLESRGFLEQEELYGENWEKRVVKNNPVDIIEKSAEGKLVDISPFEESDPSLNDKEKWIGEVFSQLGSVEVIKTVDEEGNEQKTFLSSRAIKNLNDETAFWWNEIIDPMGEATLEVRTNSEKIALGYIPKEIFLSGEYEINSQSDISATYIDLQELNKPDSESFWPGFVVFIEDNKPVKNKGLDSITQRNGRMIGMQSITELKEVVAFGHEHSHLAYSNAVKDWDIFMQEARRVFNKTDTQNLTSPDTARKLISYNERAAWDGEEKFLSWLSYQQGFRVGILDKVITSSKDRENSLLTYDMQEHQGDGVHPEAFSNLMRNMREEAKKRGVLSRYSKYTGEKISNCPLLQLALNGVDVVELMEESELVSSNELKEAKERAGSK